MLKRGKKNKGGSRKRRLKLIAGAVLVICIVIVPAAFLISRRAYGTISLKDQYIKEATGYNGRGSLEVSLLETGLDEALEDAYKAYEKSLIKDKGITEKEFKSFADTLNASVKSEGTLSNGDTAEIVYEYDNVLASKLNIKIEGTRESFMISGLEEARRISKEDLFRDISISFTGISPKLSIKIENNSSDEFIRDIVFNPIEYKEFYKNTDVVSIRAYYSEKECLKRKIIVEEKSEDCIKEYVVESNEEYLSDGSKLEGDILREAIEAGKGAFKDANTYGVRVFIEAGLVPVYINKQATFKWLTPVFQKAYFKTVREEAAEKNGNHYNDLDLIYSCDMTQADGVTTTVRAVVRFSDIINSRDQGLIYDFSSPSVISASHITSNITKVVLDNYEEDYYIEEIGNN